LEKVKVIPAEKQLSNWEDPLGYLSAWRLACESMRQGLSGQKRRRIREGPRSKQTVVALDVFRVLLNTKYCNERYHRKGIPPK